MHFSLSRGAAESTPIPVSLTALQKELPPSDLFIEYVLDDPVSYVLAVTSGTVHRYVLPARAQIEEDSTQYRSEIVKQKSDTELAEKLFRELLGTIPEYKEKRDVIVVPDGKLHLLPFSALADSGQYVLTSHLVSVAPSGTVLDILRHRNVQNARDEHPYVGVAAWISKPPSKTLGAAIRRAVSGPERRELVALPESRNEVESIASDLPKPSTILLGDHATKNAFKQLPLNQYAVIHLALHGYADPEFPDRSALVFAPHSSPADDGLLQVREIRKLPLNTNLVTLSACDTGVGPVGEEGVANIVNAFIEAGAQSVVSTLWQMEDHSTAQLMIAFYKHLSQAPVLFLADRLSVPEPPAPIWQEPAVQVAIALVEGKWRVPILRQLQNGTVRLGELRRRLSPVSKKVLNQHLRQMSDDGLVVRTDTPGRVPQVEYSLAIPLGYEVLKLLQVVSAWGDKNCLQVTNEIDRQDRDGQRFASGF